jgi:uncharacterized membrane protein
MGWLEFCLAYVVFFLSHLLPVRRGIRPWLQARLGPRGFTTAYSALSLVVLGWLIGAAARAPFVPLWDWSPWQVFVPLVAMLPVCLIVALTLARPNPLSFGGAQNDRFDVMHPGIVRWARHPLLLALTFWAVAHVVPNGDLAHAMLFGTFAAFAIFGGRLVDRRKQREMGVAWLRLRAGIATAPAVGRTIPGWVVLRLSAGLGLYATLLWLHPLLFGVSPLP